MQTLIKNGTIVSAENNVVADVLINDSQILFIGTNIEKEIRVDKELDASGCFIIPGAIDPHVHLNLKTNWGYSSDNFYTGSIAALYGGTTSIIDFVTPERNHSLYNAFHHRKEEASKSLIDYKLHVSPVEWVAKSEYEIERFMKEEGVRSFKVYMAYKDKIGLNDAAIFKVMKTVGKYGGIVAVHCEIGDYIEMSRNEFANQGKTGIKYHALSRPPEKESMAVKRAIDLASKAGCPIYIVHVSAKQSVDYIREAQEKMMPVYAETCPQYLLLDQDIYNSEFEKAAPYIISPPLRSRQDIESLWHALADRTIQTIGTDHCPFTMAQKRMGINDFRKIPNGAGGIEHRLELLYTYGVLQKKISINHFVDLVSTMPAKIFGLYPKKGIISGGSDADLVVWDPNQKRIISVNSHHQNCDSNIYQGFRINGQAKHVFIRGKQVIENGQLVYESRGFYIL